MLQEISIAEYFRTYSYLPIVDVRSPGEFFKGQIPGANNIPLFSDDERADVGKTYVRQSREKAIELGYKYVTPKLNDFIAQSQLLAPNSEIVVYCWRGGMRSRSFARHLHDNGMQKVYTIVRGYKAFRKHVLGFFEQNFHLKVLGGYTGSGKTNILNEFVKKGLQVINLEKLANHKGSAFGAINQPEQPTVEQFENNLFETWRKLNLQKPVWIEDESNKIGKVQIPMNLFQQIRQQKLVFIEIPREQRAKLLVEEYSHCDKRLLEESIYKITKRLGGLQTKEALEYLSKNKFNEVALIMLFYYDKAYTKGLRMRDQEQVVHLKLDDTNPVQNAETIIRFLNENEQNEAYTL